MGGNYRVTLGAAMGIIQLQCATTTRTFLLQLQCLTGMKTLHFQTSLSFHFQVSSDRAGIALRNPSTYEYLGLLPQHHQFRDWQHGFSPFSHHLDQITSPQLEAIYKTLNSIIHDHALYSTLLSLSVTATVPGRPIFTRLVPLTGEGYGEKSA